jgi:hypothetical protein
MLIASLSTHVTYADVVPAEIYWVLGAWALIIIGVPLTIVVLIAMWVIRQCITTTKEFELGKGRTLKIYRIPYHRHYTCSFRVKKGRKTLLQKTPFFTTSYSLTGPPRQGFTTPVGRTDFEVVFGTTSEVAGIVNVYSPHVLKALYDFKTQEYWTITGRGVAQKGQSLLKQLQVDYPDTPYVLDTSEGRA